MDLGPNVLNALTAYRNKEYPSIRATARAFSLLYTTLRRYLSSGVTRTTSYVSEQYLSPAEEKVLVKYILRLDSFGNPISPAFTRQLAYEIRLSREKPSASTTPPPFPGKHFVDRLRGRYLVIKSAYTRQLTELLYRRRVKAIQHHRPSQSEGGTCLRIRSGVAHTSQLFSLCAEASAIQRQSRRAKNDRTAARVSRPFGRIPRFCGKLITPLLTRIAFSKRLIPSIYGQIDQDDPPPYSNEQNFHIPKNCNMVAIGIQNASCNEA